MIRWGIAAVAAALIGCTAERDTPPDMRNASVPTDIQQAPTAQERVAIFDEVWRTIDRQYYDSTFHGVRWDAARVHYRPYVDSAKTRIEFYRIFEVMLGELRDAHTSFEPPPAPQQAAVWPPGDVGIRLEQIQNRTVIAHVDSASDASRAGVQPGMLLLSVNGAPIDSLYGEIRSRIRGSSTTQAMTDILHSAVLYGGFLGPTRTFGVQAFDGRVFQVEIKNFGPRSGRTAALAATMMADSIGYIRFNMWQPPMDVRFAEELARLRHAKGLIIDLRGNGGGQENVQLRIAQHLVRPGTEMGAFRSRVGAFKRSVTGARAVPAYDGPLLILLDEGSGSASEVFAISMQEHGRARIVGRRSCGCVLNQWSRKVRGGGTLRWSARVYRSPERRIIEGVGVRPDIEVELTVADLRAGRDAALEAAVAALRVP